MNQTRSEQAASIDKLCHYVKFPFFLDLVNSGSFYAARIDKYQSTDPMEGRYGDIDQQRNTAEAWEALRLSGYSDEDIDKGHIALQNLGVSGTTLATYILCFRNDDEEDNCCWDAYLQGRPGVMLKTSAVAMHSAIQEQVFFQPVAYLAQGESAIDRDLPSFLCKQKEKWEWEREVRMLKYLTCTFDAEGRHVDCTELMKAIHDKYSRIPLPEPEKLARCQKLFVDLLKEMGLTFNPFLNPDHVRIKFDLSGLFEEIILSRDVTDGQETEMRRLLDAKNVSTFVKRSAYSKTA